MNYNLLPQKGRKTRSVVAASLAVLAFSNIVGCASARLPHVVQDVPAQIDSKYSQNEYDSSKPPLWPRRYYFVMEQCQVDIETFKRIGEVATPHFDPEVHQSNPDCFLAEISVSSDEYQRYPEGTVLTYSTR